MLKLQDYREVARVAKSRAKVIHLASGKAPGAGADRLIALAEAIVAEGITLEFETALCAAYLIDPEAAAQYNAECFRHRTVGE